MTIPHTLLLHAFIAVAPAGPAQETLETLEAVVRGNLAEQGIPGAVVAFVEKGQPTTVHAFGVANLATGEAMTADTRFQVGSITKPLTATLLARLRAMERLSFEDPLSRFFELEGDLATIRLSQLLAHRSGLPREPVNRRNLPASPSVMIPMDVEELLEGLARTERRADGAVLYSNLGYAVLGAVAERAAPGHYPELLAELVLDPLGMTHTEVHLGDTLPDGLAACYWPEDSEPIEREPWHFGSSCANAGLVSTAGDLARFLAAQMSPGDEFLSREARAELQRPTQEPDPIQGVALASGWFVATMPGDLVAIAHGGEVDGHSGTMAFFPSLRTGLVVLCNRGGDSAEGLSRAVMAVALRRWMGGS